MWLYFHCASLYSELNLQWKVNRCGPSSIILHIASLALMQKQHLQWETGIEVQLRGGWLITSVFRASTHAYYTGSWGYIRVDLCVQAHSTRPYLCIFTFAFYVYVFPVHRVACYPFVPKREYDRCGRWGCKKWWINYICPSQFVIRGFTCAGPWARPNSNKCRRWK